MVRLQDGAARNNQVRATWGPLVNEGSFLDSAEEEENQ
jgi:hypothetical protein